jgi:hypothetical protein
MDRPISVARAEITTITTTALAIVFSDIAILLTKIKPFP